MLKGSTKRNKTKTFEPGKTTGKGRKSEPLEGSAPRRSSSCSPWTEWTPENRHAAPSTAWEGDAEGPPVDHVVRRECSQMVTPETGTRRRTRLSNCELAASGSRVSHGRLLLRFGELATRTRDPNSRPVGPAAVRVHTLLLGDTRWCQRSPPPTPGRGREGNPGVFTPFTVMKIFTTDPKYVYFYTHI